MSWNMIVMYNTRLLAFFKTCAPFIFEMKMLQSILLAFFLLRGEKSPSERESARFSFLLFLRPFIWQKHLFVFWKSEAAYVFSFEQLLYLSFYSVCLCNVYRLTNISCSKCFSSVSFLCFFFPFHIFPVVIWPFCLVFVTAPIMIHLMMLLFLLNFTVFRAHKQKMGNERKKRKYEWHKNTCFSSFEKTFSFIPGIYIYFLNALLPGILLFLSFFFSVSLLVFPFRLLCFSLSV